MATLSIRQNFFSSPRSRAYLALSVSSRQIVGRTRASRRVASPSTNQSPIFSLSSATLHETKTSDASRRSQHRPALAHPPATWTTSCKRSSSRPGAASNAAAEGHVAREIAGGCQSALTACRFGQYSRMVRLNAPCWGAGSQFDRLESVSSMERWTYSVTEPSEPLIRSFHVPSEKRSMAFGTWYPSSSYSVTDQKAFTGGSLSASKRSV